MRTLTTFLFFISAFVIRSSRWIAFLQQKEYRLDRLLLFLRSVDGKKELLRFIPKKSDFSYTGFKRPALTARSIVVIVFYLLLAFVTLIIGLRIVHAYSDFLDINILLEFLFILLFLLIYLLIIPLFVVLVAIPTSLVATIQTWIVLLRARNKLIQKKPLVIGITGSYGKTSTKLLLAHVLGSSKSVFYTPRSFNTRYSIATSVLKGYSDQEVAIIEYGAYKKGEIATICKWIRPDLAVVTGLTEQHLGLFGSIDNIITAKSELVAALPDKKVVVCNGYDEKTLQICQKGAEKNQAKIIGVRPSSGPAQLVNVSLNKQGKLQFEWRSHLIKTQLLGMHYQELIRIVIATALEIGLSERNIITSLESFVPNEKFIFSYRLTTTNALVVDDGDTANPKGFAAGVELAGKITSKRKILLTGGIVDLGVRSREIHLELARLCQKTFDVVLYVSGEGLEEFQLVLNQKVVPDENGIKSVLAELSEDDLLLIEGRMPPWISQVLQR